MFTEIRILEEVGGHAQGDAEIDSIVLKHFDVIVPGNVAGLVLPREKQTTGGTRNVHVAELGCGCVLLNIGAAPAMGCAEVAQIVMAAKFPVDLKEDVLIRELLEFLLVNAYTLFDKRKVESGTIVRN